MAFYETPTGSKTKVGIALQPLLGDSYNQFGGACKVTDLLDYDSGSMTVNRPALFSSALRDTPSERHKSVTGDFSGSGDYQVDVLNSGAYMKLMTALFGTPTSSSVTGGFKHIYKNTWAYHLITLAHKIGDTINYHPDTLVSSHSISGRRPADGPQQATFGLMAASRFIKETEASVGLDVAGYANASLFSQAKISIVIDGVEIKDRYNSFDLSYDRNAQPKMAFGGNLGPSGWIQGGSTLGLNISSYFDSQDDLKRFMGQLTSTALPYGFTEQIKEFPVKIILNQTTAAGATYYMEYLMPKCAINSLSEPVQGRDVVMQPMSIEPRYSATDGTDLIVTITSPDSGTAVNATGTALSNGDLPASSVGQTTQPVPSP